MTQVNVMCVPRAPVRSLVRRRGAYLTWSVARTSRGVLVPRVDTTQNIIETIVQERATRNLWRGRIAPSGTLSHLSLSFKTAGLQYMRPHHTFLRPKLLKNSATRDIIGSHCSNSSFQAIPWPGLRSPTPWGHAGGLVWVESSK